MLMAPSDRSLRIVWSRIFQRTKATVVTTKWRNAKILKAVQKKSLEKGWITKSNKSIKYARFENRQIRLGGVWRASNGSGDSLGSASHLLSFMYKCLGMDIHAVRFSIILERQYDVTWLSNLDSWLEKDQSFWVNVVPTKNDNGPGPCLILYYDQGPPLAFEGPF